MIAVNETAFVIVTPSAERLDGSQRSSVRDGKSDLVIIDSSGVEALSRPRHLPAAENGDKRQNKAAEPANMPLFPRITARAETRQSFSADTAESPSLRCGYELYQKHRYAAPGDLPDPGWARYPTRSGCRLHRRHHCASRW